MDYYNSSAELNFPKIENCPLDFDWIYHDHQQQPFQNLLLEFPPVESTFFESNLFLPLSSSQNDNHDHNQMSCFDFLDFDDFGGVFSFDIDTTLSHTHSEDTMVDEKPQTNLVTSHYNHHHDMINIFTNTTADQNMDMIERDESFGSTKCVKIRNYNKFAELELDDIQKYFDLPIKEAAKELGVGVTRLKKRCRELNFSRWPHRKFKSLKYLISNVKKMGFNGAEIKMLEEHKRLLEEAPDMELTEKTKKLRQACFKANYKNKMSLARA